MPIRESQWLSRIRYNDVRHGFRYDEQTQYVLIFTKGIRYFSLLNAAFTLLQAGHYQELYILSRCMDETLQDASLFTVPMGENGELSDVQKTFLEEFFLEEFEDPEALGIELVNTKRHRTPRRKIYQAINVASPIKDKYPAMKGVHNLLYKTFSGYVHGAYVHVMELLGGSPVRWHLKGMAGTPKLDEAKEQFATHVYRALMIGRLAAKRLGMDEADDQFVALVNEMHRHYPNIASMDEAYKPDSDNSKNV